MEVLLYLWCNLQRLKRMKQGMKEMRQWCDLMIQEDAQVEKASSEENKSLKV